MKYLLTFNKFLFDTIVRRLYHETRQSVELFVSQSYLTLILILNRSGYNQFRPFKLCKRFFNTLKQYFQRGKNCDYAKAFFNFLLFQVVKRECQIEQVSISSTIHA
jgi:hypothetical protein